MAEENNGSNEDNGENTNAIDFEYENFQQLLKRVLSVPKEEVDKKRREEQRERKAG